MVNRLFYDACTAPAWMVSIPDAGHFQFLDKQTSMQRAVCTQGRVPDYSVRQVSQVRHSQNPKACDQLEFANHHDLRNVRLH